MVAAKLKRLTDGLIGPKTRREAFSYYFEIKNDWTLSDADLEKKRLDDEQMQKDQEMYFRNSLIYFLACMIVMLFFFTGIGTKIRHWLMRRYPSMHNCLETRSELKERLEQEAKRER